MGQLVEFVSDIEQRDGVFARRTAHAAGVTDGRLRTLVASGLVRRVQPGVFVLGGLRPNADREMRWCEVAHEMSVLSHYTAAAVHRFRLVPRPKRVHMLGPFQSSARSSIAVLHRSRRLGAVDIARVGGMAVTSPERTIIDLAGALPLPRLERVLDAAIADRKVHLGRLCAVFSRLAGRGRKGTRNLRKLLRARSVESAVVESELERRFEQLVRRWGLPRPTRQVPIHRNGTVVGRVDFAWSAQRVLVEVDGRAGHQQVADFETDRRRDAEATAAGWFALRFTWRQVTREPDVVVAAVRAALERGVD